MHFVLSTVHWARIRLTCAPHNAVATTGVGYLTVLMSQEDVNDTLVFVVQRCDEFLRGDVAAYGELEYLPVYIEVMAAIICRIHSAEAKYLAVL